MADTLDVLTRTTKLFYEEITHRLMAGRIGLDQFLFPTNNIDESSSFSLDRLIENIHGVCFRNKDEQSVVRPYEPGIGDIYEVPRTSEKTPISEKLRDSVIAGIESTAGFTAQNARLLSQIITQHMSAHTATRWKLALDVIRTGIFSPTGMNGNDIGLDIDFGRDASLDITYDFTAAGATIDAALLALYNAYVALGGSRINTVVIMGEDWLAEFAGDTNVNELMQANVANVLVTQQLMPPEMNNTQHLYLAATYRIPGTLTPIYICGYKPDRQYVPYAGATAIDFMPSDEAVMFSLTGTRYKILRGVDVLDDSGKYQRAVGEVVFDSYTEKDPVAVYLRSQARYAFIPGNVNHTARSTGTFDES